LNRVLTAIALCVTCFGTAMAANPPGELVPGEFATVRATDNDLATTLAPFADRFFTDAAFDGDWFDPAQGVAIRISGKTGVATTAYGQAAQPGEIVLRLRSINRGFRAAPILQQPGASLPWFTGSILRPESTPTTYNKWRDVQGRITPLGRLLLIFVNERGPPPPSVLERGGPGSIPAGRASTSTPPPSQHTTTTPGGVTPAPAASTASFSCDSVTLKSNDLTFCNLLQEVGEQVAVGVLDKGQEIAIREVMLAVFRALPTKVQDDLFRGGHFLQPRYFGAAYRSSVNKLLKKPKLVSYFDYGIAQVFCDFIKAGFDAYAEATYLNSDQAWKYPLVQTAGDQMYVGLSLLLAPTPLTTPQARALEAVLLETQITLSHMEAATVSFFALRNERQEAVASFAGLIQMGTSVALIKEAGLQPLATANGSLDLALSTIKKAVSSSDIPRFDEVARLIYDADMARLRAGAKNNAQATLAISKAVNLAKQLDGQRSLLDRIYVTTFGSYAATTESLLKLLNLSN